MSLVGSLLSTLWAELVARLSWALWMVRRWIKTVLVGGMNGIWRPLTGIVSSLFGIVWGWVLVVALFGGAALLNAVGVVDVYGTLGERHSTDGTNATTSVQDVSPERVTDERGRFSATTFERVTGMAPAEFILVFVQRNGGRVKQQTLNACLPWSKATVSRLLDALEDDGDVERVPMGREKVVCLPDAVPDNDS